MSNKNNGSDAALMRIGERSTKLAQVLGMPQEYLQLVKDVAAKGATDEEFCLFLHIVHDTGLNPLTKEIWFYKMWDTFVGKDMPVIHASIQGMRKAAERIGGYAPGRQTEYEYDEKGELYAATAYVKRKVEGEWHEVAFTALWAEFARYNQQNKLVNKWATMPKHMLAKCAEFNALRRAFPRLEALADGEMIRQSVEGSDEPFTGQPEPGAENVPDDPEIERRRQVLIESLTHIAEILLDEEKQGKLVTWMETASLQALNDKFNTALVQFTQYARGVYEAIPEEGKQEALAGFNVEKYEDMALPELLRFVYTYQKPIEEQEHPANVEPPADPKAAPARRTS